MSTPDTGPPGDQLLREAATWFARMRGPDADSSRAEFDAWIARGALHRSAYNRAAEIFAMGKVLGGDSGLPRPIGRALDRRHRRMAVTAAAALLVVLTASWLSLQAFGDRGPAGDPRHATGRAALATGAGETRAIRLADGSVVRLTAATEIAVRFTAAARRLSLQTGQARFEVVHEDRPFVVEAGGGTVTARGTVFDVRLGRNRHVTVRLIEGAVDVALPSPAGDATRGPALRRLRAGETLAFPGAPGPGSEARMDGPDRTATPAAGAAIDFDRIPLSDLILAANRNAPRPIRLADPALGARRLSGRFRIDDTEKLADRIALLFDLVVDRGDGREILLRPR